MPLGRSERGRAQARGDKASIEHAFRDATIPTTGTDITNIFAGPSPASPRRVATDKGSNMSSLGSATSLTATMAGYSRPSVSGDPFTLAGDNLT